MATDILNTNTLNQSAEHVRNNSKCESEIKVAGKIIELLQKQLHSFDQLIVLESIHEHLSNIKKGSNKFEQLRMAFNNHYQLVTLSPNYREIVGSDISKLIEDFKSVCHDDSNHLNQLFCRAQCEVLEQAKIEFDIEATRPLVMKIYKLFKEKDLHNISVDELNTIYNEIPRTDSRALQLLGGGLIILAACLITIGILAAIPTGGTSLLASAALVSGIIVTLGALKTSLIFAGAGLLTGALGLGLFRLGRNSGLDKALSDLIDVAPKPVG